jgi:hypothetical protein
MKGTIWTRDAIQMQSSPIPPGQDAYYYSQGTNQIDDNVSDLISKVNTQIWNPGAGISFLEMPGPDGHIPIIDDADLQSGDYGDITDPRNNSWEGNDAATRCRTAWANYGVNDGIIILIVREMNQPGFNVAADITGYALGYQGTLKQKLCTYPRTINKSNLLSRFLIIIDPTLLVFPQSRYDDGPPELVLGHELGHVLTLAHGDGLDNDGNGDVPPNSGPRLYDFYCDEIEFADFDKKASTRSLMSEGSSSKLITSLQKEQARSMAMLMPGAFGGPE